MKNGGGHFAPELGGHFELESGGHFKLELGGQYHWNLHFLYIPAVLCLPPSVFSAVAPSHSHRGWLRS